jgi:hypothetical protein
MINPGADYQTCLRSTSLVHTLYRNGSTLASRVCTATMSRRRPLWILGDTNPRAFVCLEDLQLLQIAA